MGKLWAVVLGTGVLLGVVVCYLSQAVLGSAARPDPGVGLKDWLTVILAGLALIVSLAALTFNWLKAKQDTYLAIHDKLAHRTSLGVPATWKNFDNLSREAKNLSRQK
ncbi:hypothetical protein ACIQTW_05415 [Paenarthrobacter sp. NPDC090517]|uniref:hypothetical protein n=1 Tax=Paenarthrobacter sp. NPDC090517 TaxID=3364381 RepID=UPI0037F49EDD